MTYAKRTDDWLDWQRDYDYGRILIFPPEAVAVLESR